MVQRSLFLGAFSTFVVLCSPPSEADTIERVFTVGISGVVSEVEQNIEDFTFGKPAYFVGWYGKFNAEPGGIGVYASLGVPEHKLTGFTTDTNHFNVFNIGMIYSLDTNYQLYAGLGYAHQVFDDPNMNTERFYNDYLNISIGTLIRFGDRRKFGINLTYDSAPDALGVGITYPFW